MLKYPRILPHLATSHRRIRIHFVQRRVTVAQSLTTRSTKAKRRAEALIICPKTKPSSPWCKPSTPLQLKPPQNSGPGEPQQAALSPPKPSQHSGVSQGKISIILDPQPRRVKPIVAPQKHVPKKIPSNSPFIFDHMGFQWDLLKGVVSLTEAERLRCLRAVKNCKESIEKADDYQTRLQEVIGALLHASHVIVHGRSRLGLLTQAVLRRRQTIERLPQSLRERIKKHLEWWVDHLKEKCVPVKVEKLQKGLLCKEIRIDTRSKPDISLTVNGKQERLEWKTECQPNMSWADAAVIEMTVRHFTGRPGAGGTHLRITSSNAEVDSWTTGVSLNPLVNEVFFSILHTLVRSDCWLTLEWGPSQKNRSDTASRARSRVADQTGSVPTKSLPPKPNHDDTMSKTGKSLTAPEPNVTPCKAQAPSFKLFETILEPSSGRPPFTFSYMDFEWDLLNTTVSLTKNERQRCLGLVKLGLTMIDSLQENRSRLQDLVTRLLHASHVVIQGRAHLEPLITALLRRDGGEDSASSDNLKESIRVDLVWWLELLERRRDMTQISALRMGMIDNKVYTDATPKIGCAIVVHGIARSWRWKRNLIRDNNWAEAVAVEIAVRHHATQPEGKGSHFKITSDSIAIVNGWTMGRSKNPQVNRVILSIAHVLAQNGCWLSLDWIASGDNPADGPSRSKVMIGRRKTKRWNPAVIPLEIRQDLEDGAA